VVDVAAVTALAATIRDVGTRLPPPGEVTDEALAAALEALADAAGRLAVAARRALPAESAGVGAGTGAAVDPGLLPRRPRVVLVDDDETALAALAELLSDEFEIVACTDPLEGLRRAARPGADAVVTDLVMPGIDGLSLLRLLRANPATAEVPCLLLTASAQTNDKLEAFGLGAADYLMKPVDVIDLVAGLRP
jgi:CheY-like chemotaxis protein